MSGPDSPAISVVIPAFDAEDHLGDQLEALALQQSEVTFEVVVADNGSTDGTRRLVQQRAALDARFRLVDASGVPGPAYARNQGTCVSKGAVVAYCDADDVVSPGWLQGLWVASKEAALVGGRLDHEPLNDPAIRRWRSAGPMTELPTTLRFLPYAVTASMAVSRAAFDAVGGFDEALEHGEDVDFSWRVQLSGYRLRFAPSAVVAYRHRARLSGLWKQFVLYGESDAALYARYRTHGARRHPVRLVARRWFYILSRLPYLFLSDARRGLWIVVAAGAVGRFRGSVRHRVVCL